MSRIVSLVWIGVVLSGCSTWRGAANDVPADRPPVVVRLDGPALVDTASRNAATAAIAHVTRRRVEIADDAANEAVLRALATRTKRERPAVRAYDWREPRCAKHLDALVAARYGAEGVYHLTLAPTTVAPQPRGLLDAFRAEETPVTGEVTVRLVDGSGARPRAAVEGPKLSEAVADGVSRLPGLPPARWQAVANGLVKAGCPFLALAVQDLQLREAREGRAVREKALAAMARAGAPRAAAPRTPDPPAAVVATVPGTPPAPANSRYSCEALCGMHIVELCNSDRSLWSQHLVSWERAGCGSRRSEAFLVDCYRRQRISGAFHDACVRPCEASAEGRQALLGRLQGAGCLRPGSS